MSRSRTAEATPPPRAIGALVATVALAGCQAGRLRLKFATMDFARRVAALVDEYRGRCLWFLRPDYYPETREEQLRVLQQIERNGDLAAFRKAAAMRQWLSRPSSAPSVE